MAKLPNGEAVTIPREKVSQYLLDPSSPRGKDKYAYFASYGYTPDDVNVFIAALRKHVIENDIYTDRSSEFGHSYRIRCNFDTPSGKKPCIDTVWMIDATGVPPRFITAYPL